MTTNLEQIAKGFSGAIFFDGEGCVEIVETDGYFTFWESFNPVGDGSDPQYKTIFSNVSQGHSKVLQHFNLYDLSDLKTQRATFDVQKKVKHILECINELEVSQQERLVTMLYNEIPTRE